MSIRNLSIDQGSSKTFAFNIDNADGSAFDLTNYDARLQVRRTYGATSVLINCTLANSKLVKTDAVAGLLALVLAPADTSSIRFDAVDDNTLETVYDLELQHTTTGKVYKPAKGTLTISREVTR